MHPSGLISLLSDLTLHFNSPLSRLGSVSYSLSTPFLQFNFLKLNKNHIWANGEYSFLLDIMTIELVKKLRVINLWQIIMENLQSIYLLFGEHSHDPNSKNLSTLDLADSFFSEHFDYSAVFCYFLLWMIRDHELLTIFCRSKAFRFKS